MSGESIKRKTLGEDHRGKSVSRPGRHKPGPSQQARPLSSSPLLLIPSSLPPSPASSLGAFENMTCTLPGRLLHTHLVAQSGWVHKPQDGPHMAKRCFLASFSSLSCSGLTRNYTGCCLLSSAFFLPFCSPSALFACYSTCKEIPFFDCFSFFKRNSGCRSRSVCFLEHLKHLCHLVHLQYSIYNQKLKFLTALLIFLSGDRTIYQTPCMHHITTDQH